MRFLVDNNLSPRLGDLLRAGGHDVVHVRDIDVRSATDADVIEAARADGRILISADTDFGALLARTHATKQAAIIMRNLEAGHRGREPPA